MTIESPAPTIGMGCTIYVGSDSYPGTVIEVPTPRTIVVQEDMATRIDNNGMSEDQHYVYERCTSGRTWKFSLRRNGRWVEIGANQNSGIGLCLGIRRKFFDYSF